MDQFYYLQRVRKNQPVRFKLSLVAMKNHLVAVLCSVVVLGSDPLAVLSLLQRKELISRRDSVIMVVIWICWMDR